MSITLTFFDGRVTEIVVPAERTELHLSDRRLVNVAFLPRHQRARFLTLANNHLSRVPDSTFTLTQLRHLALTGNGITELPPAVGALRALLFLYVQHNALSTLPREMALLTNLRSLLVFSNQLRSVPRELGKLERLEVLSLRDNELAFLPAELDDLPSTTDVRLMGNPLPVPLVNSNCRSVLARFGRPDCIGLIRAAATTLAIALQELELPALVTLEVIDAAWPNSIAMHKKWDLVTAVKHWRQRQVK